MDYYPYIKFFEKYLLEELNKEEVADFHRRLRSDVAFSSDFEAFKKDLLKEQEAEKKVSYNKRRAWNHIQQNIYRRNPSQPVIQKEPNRYKLRIAAAILLVLLGGLGFVAFYTESPDVQMVTKITEKGQKSTLTLADGSIIQLNSNSTLIYPATFGPEGRTVYLTGEAFFEVARDPKRPFVVRSGDIETYVLGTSFNIRTFSDEDFFEIGVKTGTVATRLPDQPKGSLQLERGEHLRYSRSRHQWEKTEVNPDNIAMWTEGYLYFENESLGHVLEDLSRWYGAEFELRNDDMIGCRITLKQQNESLKNILEILKYAVGLEYELKENKIIINGKPC